MKKNSQQGLLVFILLLTLLLSYLTLKKFWLQKFTSAAKQPFAGFNFDNVDRIELTGSGKTTIFEKRAGKYVIASDEDAAADNAALSEMLDNLKNLKLAQTVSASKDKWTVFEVDEAKAIHLKFTISGKNSEIWIGKYGSDFASTYLRLGTDPQTYVTTKNIRNSFLKGDYRDLTIVNLNPVEVTELELEYQNRSFGAKKEEGLWVSLKGEKAELDTGKINNFLGKLSPLKGTGIVKADKTREADFKYPYLDLKLKTGNAALEIIIGARSNEGDHLVKTNTSQLLYTLSPISLDGFPANLADLQK